ncbi:hypothetical protein J5X84_29210 [Streptosporangiaceae bacterium NEAU-GS5]|nr:hypothetical protein [Streptosporangiaceae bacterium NEAU-GS5]
MPVDDLPDNASLEHLRKQARTLQRDVHAEAPEALVTAAEFHPRFAGPESFTLSDAQLVTARRYGFASWPRLRVYVETLTAYARRPHEVGPASGPQEFLRLACLTYGADTPNRIPDARRMLADEPELATANVFTMAATGRADALRDLLDREPELVDRQGGPYAWEPLLYLAYSRVGEGHVEAARVLLDRGADPNAGYLWEGLVPPFTALTGAFGGGEGDQPAHPDGLALARLLLDRGADPNDCQTLYNRGLGGSWNDDTTHLELLLAYGLGQGDGGPWKARLGHAQQSPAEMVSEEVMTAALRGGPRRMRLLLDHGAPADARGLHPAYRGRSAYEFALVHGHTDVAEMLAAAGATATLNETDAFVAACMRGERPDLGLLERMRGARPNLINVAAEDRKPAAVRLLAELGFDVNHLYRSTPLHEAAWNDDVPMARLLIELGADPSLTDRFHQATPLGWAEYGGKNAVAEYLRNLGA